MRRMLLSVAAIWLIVFFVRPAAAQQAATAIAGTVTASADGTPIVFATVNVYDANRSIVASVVTNSSGVYTMSLKPGTYYVRFSASGFVPVAFDGISCAAQSCYSSGVLGVTPTLVTVTANSTTTLNEALDRGATISGTITMADDHTPVSNTAVYLYDASTSPVATTRTARDGTYSFIGVPFGTYFARTDRSGASVLGLDVLYGGTLCPGGATPRCRIDSGVAIVVSGGAPSATANFSLPVGGSIFGAVFTPAVSQGGRPFTATIASAPVVLYSGSTQIAATQADSSGMYRFSALDPGTYFVRTNVTGAQNQWYQQVCAACPGAHPTPVAVSAGAASQADFLVAFGTGGISGTLTLDQLSTFPPFFSRPAVLLPDVQIYNTDGTLVQTSQVAQGTGDTVQWSVSGLPDGTYYVRTSSYSLPPYFLSGFGTLPATGYWVDELYDNKTCVAADCDPRLGTPVIVANGQMTPGINLSLDLGAQISGSLDAGFELPATLVEVYDSRGVRLPQRSGTQAGDSSSHAYGALGLPAGTYYLVATSLPSGVSRELYNGIPCAGCGVTSGTPVTVTLGQKLTGINFPVIPDRKISGTVRSDASANPPNQLLSTIGVEAYWPNGELASSTTTLADGTYVVPRLSAGTYTVRTHNMRGFVDQTYATPVVIPSGSDVTGIDFTLTQGQTISGQVGAANGGPIPGAGVLVYASSAASPAAHVTADTSGFFVANVAAGSYFVQTDPVAGYQQQIYDAIACPQGTCPTGSATQVLVASAAVTGVNFSLLACFPRTISPVSLANAAVGSAYRQTLLVSSTVGAIGFAVTSGTLPPGLTLDSSTGVISGTPTASGRFTFTVGAVDSTGCAGSRTYALDVQACVVTLLALGSQKIAIAGGGGGYDLVFTTTCSSATVMTTAPWMTVSGPYPLPFQNGVQPYTAVWIPSPNTGGIRQGTIAIGPQLVTVTQQGVGTDMPPFGAVDTPVDGAIVSGSIAITGWALDDFDLFDVEIYRDPVAGESGSQIFVGFGTFVAGARPDVAALYPRLANSDRAGWGYLLLTNMLPNHGNGTFRLLVYARAGDTAGGPLQQTLIGTKVINAVNSSATVPFGAIDTPDQGATVSGSALVNFGWALTPQPKMIPFDGSTIHVLIDGVNVGTVAAYNLFRPDVSGLFPGLKNSGGPVGYRVIDTTALSEGTHTIAWVATDDGGITTGIGSRYFTVSNSAWQPSLRANVAVVPPAVSASELAQATDPGQGVSPDGSRAVPPRVDGVDIERKAASLAGLPVDAGGARAVTLSNLQSLRLSLHAGTEAPAYNDASSVVGRVLRPDTSDCAATYAGYLVVNGELRPLPVGSSLDHAGTFYWHPGPGFFGTYHLLFVRTGCDGSQQRIPISIVVR